MLYCELPPVSHNTLSNESKNDFKSPVPMVFKLLNAISAEVMTYNDAQFTYKNFIHIKNDLDVICYSFYL